MMRDTDFQGFGNCFCETKLLLAAVCVRTDYQNSTYFVMGIIDMIAHNIPGMIPLLVGCIASCYF